MLRWILATLLLAGALRLSAASVETETFLLSGEDALNPRMWTIEMATGPRAKRGAEPIPVPANWELVGFGDFTYGHDEEKAVDRGRYRMKFTADPAWRGRAIDLVFEGVMTDATVTLDGVSVGPTHRGGYTEFRYDVTRLIRPGAEQELVVDVTERSTDESINLAEREADYWVFGGIYRPVRLEIHPNAHLAHLAIDAGHDGRISVDIEALGLDERTTSIEAELVEGGSFRQTVLVARGVAQISGKATGIQPWSAESPHLATLEVRLVRDGEVLHRRRERIGFRTVRLDERGFFLNDTRVFLKGVNRHDSWPATGRAISKERAYADAELIRSLGLNAVRTAHYPPTHWFLEACDELGLYVLDELPGWHDAYDTEVGIPLVSEMVRRDVNHPSIVAWANGNEGGWNEELIPEFARHDPQRRPVILPDTIHDGLDTKHYPNWAELEARLAGDRWSGGDRWPEAMRRMLEPPSQVLPTEMLHGLWDGGGGASLIDYFDRLRRSPRGAGFFLWAFADESVRRDMELDSAGNLAPDGIVDAWRTWEASAWAVREILRPVVAVNLPPNLLQVRNRLNFTDLAALEARWTWLTLPKARDSDRTIRKLGEARGTASPTPPGRMGELVVGPPPAEADFLEVTFRRPIDGREVSSQRIDLSAARRPSLPSGPGSVTAEGSSLVLTAGVSEARIDRASGELLSLRTGDRELALQGGTRRADGTRARVAENWRAGDSWIGFNFENGGHLVEASWQLAPDGRLRFSWQGNREPGAPWDGVRFELPGSVAGLEWVGDGPCPVWRNRLAGGGIGRWSEPDRSLGLGCNQARGFFASRWMRIAFDRAVLIVETLPAEHLWVGVDVPVFPEGSKLAVADLPPPGGLTLLHELPAMGNKFHSAADLGPSAAPSDGTLKHVFGAVDLSLAPPEED